MALKPCPRCKQLIPCGKDLCDTCKTKKEQERAKARAPITDKGKQCRAFYKSAAWRRTSQARLAAAQYVCEAKLAGCTGMAVEVHHIKQIQTPEGWELRLDWNNLEAVCVRCHNRRHDR